jgi:anthranilate phosphoribosyltransferase
MKDLISKLESFSDDEKLSVLEKQYTAQELVDLLEELLNIDPKIDSGLKLFDCCGTGGDKANTFNISTTAAILAASKEIKVSKNGGRSSSSKTGSVDVLEALGVNFSASLESKLIGLKEYGLAFHNSKAIAETLAPLKNYARENKISSFLSLLGPFTNPFILNSQIIGVGQEAWFDTMIELAKHCVKKEYVENIALVQSKDNDGQVFDELTSLTEARIRIINEKYDFEVKFDPKKLRLKEADLKLLKSGADHKENAEILTAVINNTANQEKIDTCLLNASLLHTLNAEFTQRNFLVRLAETYRILKIKFKSGVCQSNWQAFLSHNQNN